MRAAAIACQVVQSEPGWNLWGLRISRGHVPACLQICCALLLKGGGNYPNVFVTVWSHQK